MTVWTPVNSEAQWTTPRPDCPRPDYWHAPDAHSTECEVSELVAAFVRALQPDYVIETGTCWGQTAEAIGQALQKNGHGRLVTLEVELQKVAHSAERCAGLPVAVLRCDSMQFTPEQQIGFAFFDSLIHLRIPEFERYKQWLPAGTIVGFHDTSPHHGDFGIELEQRDDIRTIRLRTPRGVTFAEVL